MKCGAYCADEPNRRKEQFAGAASQTMAAVYAAANRVPRLAATRRSAAAERSATASRLNYGAPANDRTSGVAISSRGDTRRPVAPRDIVFRNAAIGASDNVPLDVNP